MIDSIEPLAIRCRVTRGSRKRGYRWDTTIKLAAIGAVAFMVLDGVWLGLLMKNFYREQLAPIVRLADGGIAPNWPAAFVVYALLGTGIALFVIPRASTVSLAAAYGALFGLVVYGVYDFTNYSTLRQWPFVLTLADVGVGSGGVRRVRGGRADRGPVSGPRAAPARYPIRAVSKLTGHRHRHAARLGAPPRRRHARSATIAGRMYTEADVARLRLLQRRRRAGTQHRAPGRAQRRSELRDLCAAAGADALPAAAVRHGGRRSIPPRSSPRCASTTPPAIDQEIARLAAVLRPLDLLQDVLMPVLAQVGDDWHRGRTRIAQEHLMSSTMRNLLGAFLRLYARREASVRLLFATPSGERHEIATLGAAMLAASSGLGVSYLGADLPAREIVDSVEPAGAQVLVLGLTTAVGRQGARTRAEDDRPRSPEGRRAVGRRTWRRASRRRSSAREGWSCPTTTPTSRNSSASADAWRDTRDTS